MANETKPEVWQRGAVDGVPALLQPVAHALLQAAEEVELLMHDFPEEKLWVKPAQLASVAFHLQHMNGVLNRLFTYAKGEKLNDVQLAQLALEGIPAEGVTTQTLLSDFKGQVDKALAQLKTTDETTLTAFRGIGRAQLPSTVLGLLFHAAEHTMRHLGQLIVTVKVVQHIPKAG